MTQSSGLGWCLQVYKFLLFFSHGKTLPSWFDQSWDTRYIPFRVTGSLDRLKKKKQQVFGLWEEAGVPAKRPRVCRENMQQNEDICLRLKFDSNVWVSGTQPEASFHSAWWDRAAPAASQTKAWWSLGWRNSPLTAVNACRGMSARAPSSGVSLVISSQVNLKISQFCEFYFLSQGQTCWLPELIKTQG